MVSLKCGSSNIIVKDSGVASLGMESVKDTLQVSYWGFKVISKVTNNFDHKGSQLASIATRGIAGLIKSSVENIEANVRKVNVVNAAIIGCF